MGKGKFQGMGGMGGMGDILKQARMVQERLQKAQEDLADIVVEGSAGGGVVQAKANGKQEVLSITIDPSAVVDLLALPEDTAIAADDVEMLADMVLCAVRDALSRAQEKATSELNQATGGMLPPGLF
ncbi:MAG: YbaB/EbfC family nucleoid-associated protein [Gemmatimonadota bacterium]|nr:YbaB/EbfC family nucleoid-associated protein [Gemmatimonadota bacterium]